MPDTESGESDADSSAEQPDADDEKPEIEADERADLPADLVDELAEEVEDEAGRGDPDEIVDDPDDEADQDDVDEDVGGDASWGEEYCAVVGLLAQAAAEELGDGEPDRDADDVAALLREPPLNVDDNLDRLLAEMGQDADLPPGKAVLLGTGAVVAIVLLTETDLLGQALDGIGAELNLDL